MPSYAFSCEKCKKEFEMTLTMTERAKARIRCPSCKSEKVMPQVTLFTAKTSRKS
jgi:putative FmdB family regulatory protein